MVEYPRTAQPTWDGGSPPRVSAHALFCASALRIRSRILMLPSDVERELFRLHQYRKLDYQIAGSLVQLSLPCASACEYAERMVA